MLGYLGEEGGDAWIFGGRGSGMLVSRSIWCIGESLVNKKESLLHSRDLLHRMYTEESLLDIIASGARERIWWM
jgi:hypothetical protein